LGDWGTYHGDVGREEEEEEEEVRRGGCNNYWLGKGWKMRVVVVVGGGGRRMEDGGVDVDVQAEELIDTKPRLSRHLVQCAMMLSFGFLEDNRAIWPVD
jgi:hypothetical protein